MMALPASVGTFVVYGLSSLISALEIKFKILFIIGFVVLLLVSIIWFVVVDKLKKSCLELKEEQIEEPIILHTDQGPVYSSKKYNNLLNEYRVKFENLISLQSKIKKMSGDKEEKARRIDILNYQIDEIEKLCAYAKMNNLGAITLNDIDNVCCKTVEYDDFRLTNALLDKNKDLVFETLRRQKSSHEPPFGILSSVIRLYMEMYLVSVHFESGMNKTQISRLI